MFQSGVFIFYRTQSTFLFEILRNLINFGRSTYRKCSVKKGVLKIFPNFIGNYPCWSLFFLPGLKACKFMKKRLQHWLFPVKFAKFLRTAVLKDICERRILFSEPCYCLLRERTLLTVVKLLSKIHLKYQIT